MNLLIYYNVNQKNFYIVYTNYIGFEKRVGYENGFGHILVQILAYRNNKFVSIDSYTELLNGRYKESIKSRLARRAIRWLNKYRE